MQQLMCRETTTSKQRQCSSWSSGRSPRKQTHGFHWQHNSAGKRGLVFMQPASRALLFSVAGNALDTSAMMTHGLIVAQRANTHAHARKHSATGTRARVARVRPEYPNQLDYSGWWRRPERSIPEPFEHKCVIYHHTPAIANIDKTACYVGSCCAR